MKNPPKTEEEWKKKLSPKEYKILRQKGTELPFTGKYYLKKEKGNYYCKGCGNKLFSSKSKINSLSGWPSFFEAFDKKAIKFKQDRGAIEVLCSKCGGHLGHVFDHQKSEACPTGKRYCINSVALDFKKR